MARIQVIVVMGVTGVGKSTFIQYATGKEVKIGHGQEACTAEVKMYQIPDTNVYLMDTPGFDDTYLSDREILNNIATALADAFNDEAEIQGALYVHQVTEARMRGSGRKNLIMFLNVLGEKGMNHCRLVTTKWSKQDVDESEDRERELCEKKEMWQPLLAAGAKTVRFGDSMESAIDIIRPLVRGSSFKPLLLTELLDQHKDFEETTAGILVNDDIETAKKVHFAEIADLKSRAERAEGEFKELLDEERKVHKDALIALDIEQRKMKEPVVSSSGRFGRWVARGCAWVGGGLMTGVSLGGLAPAAALLIAGTEAAVQVHKHSN